MITKHRVWWDKIDISTPRKTQYRYILRFGLMTDVDIAEALPSTSGKRWHLQWWIDLPADAQRKRPWLTLTECLRSGIIQGLDYLQHADTYVHVADAFWERDDPTSPASDDYT